VVIFGVAPSRDARWVDGVRNEGAADVDDVAALAALHPRRCTLRELLVGDSIFRLALGAEKLHAAVVRRRRDVRSAMGLVREPFTGG
jgi:hypothetical protein